MIAIAIVALLMGGGLWIIEMRARSAAYRQRTFELAKMTASSTCGSGIITKDGRTVIIYDNENAWLHDAWVSKLAEKYQRLSHYPWLPVEPDPPPPERLAHPRPAVDLPAEMDSARRFIDLDAHAPGWTFLWTWRRQ